MNVSGKNRMGFVSVDLLIVLTALFIFTFIGWGIWGAKKAALPVVHNSESQTKKVTTPSQSLPVADSQPKPQVTQPSTSPPAAVKAGVRGQTTRGVATGCYSPDPNSTCGSSPPVKATLEIQSNGKSITTITSDTSGYFSVDLPPGSYILIPKPLTTKETASSQRVTVVAGQYTEVNITYN